MTRANRHYIPGCVWHITHRCHKHEFLLKFGKDRKRWLYWLYQARKRYGLSVLNYIVTSNHIHLLVVDTGREVISKSLQLIAGRTAQEYNVRKKRKGSFWEDRYHATAVETDKHLAQCLVYIDLNMVRAGVVRHPSEYKTSGYNELQNPPKRYLIIDLKRLHSLFGFVKREDFLKSHREWISEELRNGLLERNPLWGGSVAVGSELFLKDIQQKLSGKVQGRGMVTNGQITALHEPQPSYNTLFDHQNSILRDEIIS